MPQLIDVLAKAYSAKPYTSTQEQAWMLLAARALGEQANAATLDGQRRGASGQADPLVDGGGPEGRGPSTIANDGGRADECGRLGDRRRR